MSAQYGQPPLTNTSTDKLHEDFIPESVTQNGIYKVLSNDSVSDYTATDHTIGTLTAPAGKTYFVPTNVFIICIDKTGSITVIPNVNIGASSGTSYDDIMGGKDVPTGVGGSLSYSIGSLNTQVYTNGTVIKMHKNTAISGGTITTAVLIFGYWY